MRFWPPWRHAALASGLAAAVVAEASAQHEWDTAIAAGASAASLAWVRRAPMAVAAIVLGVYAVVPASTNTVVLSVIPYLVSLAYVGRYASLRGSVAVAIGAALVLGLTDLDATKSTSQLIGNLVYYALFSGVILTGGQLLKFGDRRERQLEAVARDIDEGAAERERLAIAAERARIARELHDIVAQALTVIGVHAAVVRQHAPDTAPQVVASLNRIEIATEQASTDMRRLLGLLRESPGQDAPLPHLDRLPELMSEAEQGGLTVDLDLDLTTELPPALDLAAYRVIQEALTNTQRHAPGAHADIVIRDDGRTLTIKIEDDGPGGELSIDRGPPGAGLGLVGMRERAAIYGGTMAAGPTSSQGFRVCVTFPLHTQSRVAGASVAASVPSPPSTSGSVGTGSEPEHG